MVKKRKPKVEGVYCVIGVNAPGFDHENRVAYKRRWHETQDDAADHAEKLLQFKVGRGMKANRLLVVRVVEVVEVSGPPITHRTDVTRADVSWEPQ